MAEFSPEKRRASRVPVRVEASIRMLLPEETFTPFPMRGFTRDISLSGLRFETRETTEDYYRLIIRKIRYARIIAVLPGTPGEVTLLGRVVWVQFNNKMTPPLCAYGISFEDLGAEEQDAVRKCVEMITQETAPGVADGDIEVKMEGKIEGKGPNPDAPGGYWT